MTVLTDVDIKRVLGKDIVIEPYSPNALTPVGYDFSIGDFVFSLEYGLLDPQNDCYMLPAKSTVQILTKESLWVSGRIAGAFHSRVSLVSKGLSHISTTLDPGWYGPLLITLRNNTDKEISLKVGSFFVTLMFFRVQTPTRTPSWKPEFRKDILTTQLSNQTERYIEKIQLILGNPRILEEFKHKVEAANRPMYSKIWLSVQNRGWREMWRGIGIVALSLLVICSVTLQFYWDQVKWLFMNVKYDSTIVTAQIACVALFISLLSTLRRK
ncbi:MAG TPA: hypothetical protein VFV38_20265 [Ktedonobacteraceae bacterium]|nr:hypothetical protein [Ktedonobacteraceae bacterium]